MKKIIVVGSGIVGCFIAHELSKYEVEVTVLEKHHDLCEEVSAANSAIIHAGYDPKEGTLKALLNKRGADLYPALCRQLHVDYVACGALVVACNEEEERTLHTLYQRAIKRDIKAEFIDLNVLRKQEPNLSQQVCKAMRVSDTAMVTPWEICYALMDECLLNGVDLCLDEEVISICVDENHCLVKTKHKQYEADMMINASGLGAQAIMDMIEQESLFTITPKRGQYYVLSKQACDFVHEIIYPVPSSAGKGVLVVPTVDGNILLGPNSEIIDDMDNSTTSEGLSIIKAQLAKTVANVPYQEVIHTYSGIRPTGNDQDFYIDYSHVSKRVIHCACIDSPGLASAPAIAKYVLHELVKPYMTLYRKSRYHHRSASIRMRNFSLDEKQECIAKKPLFGRIVCRCERVSEQEVIDCIHRPCGARSIKGVKKRVRPGMGKCQGGFCEIEIAKILARELHIPLAHVCYDEKHYFEEVKGASK